jgi:hypothetical protein
MIGNVKARSVFSVAKSTIAKRVVRLPSALTSSVLQYPHTAFLPAGSIANKVGVNGSFEFGCAMRSGTT